MQEFFFRFDQGRVTFDELLLIGGKVWLFGQAAFFAQRFENIAQMRRALEKVLIHPPNVAVSGVGKGQVHVGTVNRDGCVQVLQHFRLGIEMALEFRAQLLLAGLVERGS